jgi:hypothetical protein
MGAEEILGRYNPSAGNDKVLALMNKYRDEELERLRMSGLQQAQAKRESLQNIAAIPDKMVDAYEQGMEENRRQKRQAFAEEQAAREREIHPLQMETQKQALERSKFGLTEEQKAAQDAQRKREYLQGEIEVPGVGKMSQEQYAWYLDNKARETGIKQQEAGISAAKSSAAAAADSLKTGQINRQLMGEQLLGAQEARAVEQAAAQYQTAMQKGDSAELAKLDKQYGSTMKPELLSMARSKAQQFVASNTLTANIAWSGSNFGEKTQAELAKLQNKATKIQQLKTYIKSYNDAPANSDASKTAKQNITSILNSEALGEEGKILAANFNEGILGVKYDVGSGFSKASERIDEGLKKLQDSLTAQLNQLELQNSHVKVPAYINSLQSTQEAVKQALQTPTNPPPVSLFSNPQGQNKAFPDASFPKMTPAQFGSQQNVVPQESKFRGIKSNR